MSTASDPWGRVAEDGTVYVRTADGRAGGGLVAGGQPRRGPGLLQAQVRRRWRPRSACWSSGFQTTDLSPGQAKATIARLRGAVADAHAIGDLDGLRGRLEALSGLAEHRREEHKAAREQARSRGARASRSASSPRPSGSRPRPPTGRSAASGCAQLLEEWKAAPRGDRDGRDGAVEAAVGGPQRVRQAPQGVLRRPRGGARGPGPARRSWSPRPRTLARLDRLGPTAPALPRPDAAVEGGRAGPTAPPRTSCGGGSRPPRTASSHARVAVLDAKDAELREHATPRSSCWPRRRSCCR